MKNTIILFSLIGLISGTATNAASVAGASTTVAFAAIGTTLTTEQVVVTVKEHGGSNPTVPLMGLLGYWKEVGIAQYKPTYTSLIDDVSPEDDINYTYDPGTNGGVSSSSFIDVKMAPKVYRMYERKGLSPTSPMEENRFLDGRPVSVKAKAGANPILKNWGDGTTGFNIPLCTAGGLCIVYKGALSHAHRPADKAPDTGTAPARMKWNASDVKGETSGAPAKVYGMSILFIPHKFGLAVKYTTKAEALSAFTAADGFADPTGDAKATLEAASGDLIFSATVDVDFMAS